MIHFRIYRSSENVIYNHCSVFGNNVFVYEYTKYGKNFVKYFTKSKNDKVMMGFNLNDHLVLFDGDIVKLNDQSIYEIKIENGQTQFHMLNKPGANLGIIENMVVNLIQVSDENIKDSEARAIYTKILSNLGEKELSSLLTYTNGIIYGIRIDSVTGELIFFARESEDEKAVTSIQRLNFINKKKVDEKTLAKLGENK